MRCFLLLFGSGEVVITLNADANSRSKSVFKLKEVCKSCVNDQTSTTRCLQQLSSHRSYSNCEWRLAEDTQKQWTLIISSCFFVYEVYKIVILSIYVTLLTWILFVLVQPANRNNIITECRLNRSSVFSSALFKVLPARFQRRFEDKGLLSKIFTKSTESRQFWRITFVNIFAQLVFEVKHKTTYYKKNT